MEERLRNRIVVKETRIPVDAIIHRIADGMSIDEIVEDYPQPEENRCKSCSKIFPLNYSLF